MFSDAPGCGPQVSEPANHWTSASGRLEHPMFPRPHPGQPPAEQADLGGRGEPPDRLSGADRGRARTRRRSRVSSRSSTSIPMAKPSGRGRTPSAGRIRARVVPSRAGGAGRPPTRSPHPGHQLPGTRPAASTALPTTDVQPSVRQTWGLGTGRELQMVMDRGRGRRYGYGRPGRRVRATTGRGRGPLARFLAACCRWRFASPSASGWRGACEAPDDPAGPLRALPRKHWAPRTGLTLWLRWKPSPPGASRVSSPVIPPCAR
jgi:hypothetical protein